MRTAAVVGMMCFLAAQASGVAASEADDSRPILIGLNAEIGHLTSTSDDAIRQGIQIAMEEVNRSGGVLGGRKFELVVKDNRAIPARAVENNRELAALPNLVAVFCGKFSSAIVESLPLLHVIGLPLLDPWAANDKVIDNGYNPNYAFRLSLRDSWAVPAMLNHAKGRGLNRLGLLLVNTSWGRNNLEVAKKFAAAHPEMKITTTQWYNYGDKSLLEQYQAIAKSGAQAVILAAVEVEGSLLVRELATLPPTERLPVISHWSLAGGDFPALAGEALGKVDLVFVQTFDLHHDKSPRAQTVLATAKELFGTKDFAEVTSPCGLAHGYDLMHLLALAVGKAGATDRKQIRNALEDLGAYEGLIRRYDRPFTASRHEALGPENVFMARYDADGRISPVK